MLTVPVVDLSNGIVVQAVAGKREKYQAIRSKICNSSDPLEVINGILNIFKFKTLYIADLDALEQKGNHYDILATISNTFPDLEIWIDTGYLLIHHYLYREKLKNVRIILPSESLPSLDSYLSTINQFSHHDFILSLDYKSGQFLGLKELLQYKEYWPKDVIVINLNSVGMESGVCIPTDLNLNTLANNFNVFYGGGISDISEIKDLKSSGFAGALVSTALHKKSISGKDIQQLNR
jgi:phosphoribosylformimino-5-aminoimidazole carboxamide ribotide isomerase